MLDDMQQANRMLVAKDYDGAIVLFLKHAEDHPVDRPKSYAKIAECYKRSNTIKRPVPVAAGITLVSEGNLAVAEQYYRMALQIDPNHFASLCGLADLPGISADERIELLERATSIQAGTLTLINLGDLYRSHRKDLSRAYELYVRAQRHQPRDQTAYQKLNDICRRMGMDEEAAMWSARWSEAKNKKHRVDGKTG